jgi:Zn-finger nucleic acid-binding protein
MTTMLCPACKNLDLVMTERQGIEIDYCPNCRGVWLDRGELDKLIDRSVQLLGAGPAVPMQVPAQAQSRAHDSHQGYKDSDFGHQKYGHGQQGQQVQHGQRQSFWRDLFD